MVTANSLRQYFAASKLPADPTAVVTLPGSERWPASMREQLEASLKPAGVLVPIFDRGDHGMSLLLTQRSAELKHHAGQIAFPGGRMEPDDADIRVTALRETHEEVGIAPEQVSVIGYLEPMPTVTGYAVTPVIGLIDAATRPEIDRTEVEFVFEVPLSFLLQDGNRRLVERDIHGMKVPMVEFHYDGHRIWGATAFIILQLVKIIKN